MSTRIFLLCLYATFAFAEKAVALDESAFSRPVKILALGDSITMVQANTSYRYPLWRRLIDHGVDVDFLGTLSDTKNLTSPERPAEYRGRTYDGDHEGHWGWTADEVLAKVDDWLDQYDIPDIALIHLGTNDSFRGQDNIDTFVEIGDIIDRLKLRNPRILIVVAKIFPGFWGDVRPLNEEIAKLAGSGVFIADCYTGIDLQTDTDDYAHPNASGGEKMAAAWWKVLERRLDPWRQTFERWSAAHGGQLVWNGDNDGDGWINYLEFGARTHPLDVAQQPQVNWNGSHWEYPWIDPLRTGNSVSVQSAASPSGPFQDGLQPDADNGFVRWLVQQ